MNKKIMYSIIILLSFCFINNVSAETFNYSHLYTFTESVDSTNEIVSSVDGNATIKDEALYLDGSTYIKYNLNSSLASRLVFDFDFYKSNTASYSRMVYLGGINREIEVKGSSDSMYINGSVSTGWLQDEWNNMKIVYENGIITYFVNDVQIKQEDYSGVITFIQFGKGSSSSNMFTGYIDNLTIYMNNEKIYVTSDYRSDFYLPDKVTDLGDYENNYNRAYEYYLNNCVGNYDSYYISKNGYGSGYGSNQVDLLCFNSSNNQITPGVRFGYYSSKKYMFYMNFQIYYSSNKDYSFNYFYDDSESINNATFTNMEYGPMSQSIYSWFDIRSGEIKSDNGIISTNIDFSLINNSNTSIADSVIEVQGININDTIYNLGDLIYKYGSLSSSEIIPEISIIKESNNITNYNEKDYITSVNLKIDYGTIDNDKYLYMYKYGSDSEWTTITLTENTYFTNTYSENNTLYVQVLSKEDYSVVTSSIFTVTSIETLPDDYFEDNLIEDTINTDFNSKDTIFHKCKLNLEVGYAICEVEINNYNNTLYNYYYKIGDNSYTKFFPDEKTQVLPEVYDDTLFIKSLDDISLYQKWQSVTDENKTYILALKIYENTTITILKQDKNTGSVQYYTFKITSFLEDNVIGDIQDFLDNHLLSKLVIVSQLKKIYDYMFLYEFIDGVAPKFSFNLSFIGLGTYDVVMAVAEDTRILIHGYIKAFAVLGVLYTFIKEISKWWPS